MFLLVVCPDINAVLVGIKIIIAAGQTYAGLPKLQHIFGTVFCILPNIGSYRRTYANSLQVCEFIYQAFDIVYLIDFIQFGLKRGKSLLSDRGGIHTGIIKVAYLLRIGTPWRFSCDSILADLFQTVANIFYHYITYPPGSISGRYRVFFQPATICVEEKIIARLYRSIPIFKNRVVRRIDTLVVITGSKSQHSAERNWHHLLCEFYFHNRKIVQYNRRPM